MPQERVQNLTVERVVDVQVPQIQEKNVEVIQFVPHVRMSDRIVEQIVELYRVLERVVEQIIDVQKQLAMEKIVKVQKNTQQVEDTQYRHSVGGEDFKSGSRSDSLNKLWTYRSSQNSQENDAEKEFNRPSERSSK